jgi:hypothetical protein
MPVDSIVRAIQSAPDFDVQYAAHCRCVATPLSRAEYARRRREWERVIHGPPGYRTGERMRELSAILGF